MMIESPHLPSPVPATRESIAELIPRLVGVRDPFAIVSGGDEMTYAQVIWTGDGFAMDYQAGSMTRHFRTVRGDLSVDETVAALSTYAGGRPIWEVGLEFHRIELRSLPRRFGYVAGRLIGSLSRLFR